MQKKTFRKLKNIILGSAILCVLSTSFAYAGSWYRVEGRLNTSVHYVPVLKDTATAITMITNPNDFSTAASRTYSYAYNSAGEYDVAYGEAVDFYAVEGWSCGQAEASIRAMVKANGTHSAKSDCTDNAWVTVYTSWYK